MSRLKHEHVKRSKTSTSRGLAVVGEDGEAAGVTNAFTCSLCLVSRRSSSAHPHAHLPALFISRSLHLTGHPPQAGRAVADFLGTDHHEFHFTVQEGIDAISEVIYHIETFDTTTVRCHTPVASSSHA